MDHLSCTTGPASQRLWLCMVIAVLKWFFWRARRLRDGECQQEWQYHIGSASSPVSQCTTLYAACLRVKVESITILTESPALNWPCAAFAYRHCNVIRCHGQGRCLRQLPCSDQGSGKGRYTRGAELGSITDDCSGLWLAKYKQSASQSPGWSWLNKYSKISNSCVSFESNWIVSNYSIRFEISNIRTVLLWNNSVHISYAKMLHMHTRLTAA